MHNLPFMLSVKAPVGLATSCMPAKVRFPVTPERLPLEAVTGPEVANAPLTTLKVPVVVIVRVPKVNDPSLAENTIGPEIENTGGEPSSLNGPPTVVPTGMPMPVMEAVVVTKLGSSVCPTPVALTFTHNEPSALAGTPVAKVVAITSSVRTTKRLKTFVMPNSPMRLLAKINHGVQRLNTIR